MKTSSNILMLMTFKNDNNKAKKNKCYVSKLVTDWKTWPKCRFFLTVFFFSWAADVSDLSRSQLWNMELDFGWARYKTEHRVEQVCCSKCYIVSVISFLVYFDKQVRKRLEKKLSKPKKFKLWILLNQTRTEKQMRAAALRHRIYFFLA